MMKHTKNFFVFLLVLVGLSSVALAAPTFVGYGVSPTSPTSQVTGNITLLAYWNASDTGWRLTWNGVSKDPDGYVCGGQCGPEGCPPAFDCTVTYNFALPTTPGTIYYTLSANNTDASRTTSPTLSYQTLTAGGVQCQATRGIIYAAFALLAIGAIVLAAWLLIHFGQGGDMMSNIGVVAVTTMALAVTLLVGYYVTYFIALAACV